MGNEFSSYRSWLKAVAITVQICALSSCVDRELNFAQIEDVEQHSQIEIYEVPNQPSTQERSEQLDRIREQFTSSSEKSDQLTELLRTLQEINEAPETYGLKVSELRELQKAIFDLGANAPVIPGIENPELPRSEVLDLSNPSSCPDAEVKVQILSSGLRLVNSLPRKNNCSRLLSKRFQDGLNQILLGSALAIMNGEEKIAEVNNFQDLLGTLEDQGYSVSAEFRTYLAPFVKLYSAEGDLYDHATEIPLPMWINTEFKVNDFAANQVVIPAPHSEVMFHFTKAEQESALVKIYFSDKGLVFDDEDLHIPYWAGEKTLHRFEKHEVLSLLEKSKEAHQAFEIFRSRAPDFPAGGFGVLGVCNDGSSLIMRAQLGLDFLPLFPMARNAYVTMPENFPLKEAWNSLQSDLLGSEQDHKTKLKRIYRSNPFEGRQNPFPNFERLLIDIEAEIRDDLSEGAEHSR
ncbi:hypothetical protein GW916_12655 [bacterium]|nr:hypothetical protein [bacterium]